MVEHRMAMPAGQDELFTLDAAAEYLCVSKPTLYRMLDRGEVKGCKVGRQWRFRSGDLDAYLARGPVAMTLATVPMEVLDSELAFFAQELTLVGATLTEATDATLDPWEAKMTLLLTHIAQLAFVLKASDIHLEPLKEEREVVGMLRFRMDGMLHEVRRMPVRVQEALVLRVRQLTDQGASERGYWVNDHLRVLIGDTPLDMRLSIMTAALGESLQARLLVEGPLQQADLDRLGFYPEDVARIRTWLHRREGAIFTAGLKGNGKTTVMYKMLQEVAGPTVRAVSIEDPIEFHLPWVTQLAYGKNVNFGQALRAFLRHDTDVIMVGEMRDLETLELTLHAAQNGNLVLASVHVDNALRVIQRIIEVFPVAQQDQVALILTQGATGVLALRLVRTLCPHCKVPGAPATAMLARAGHLADEGGYNIPADAIFHTAVGCERCRGTGYQGRTLLYELLEMTPELREAYLRKASIDDLRALATHSGYRTLAATGIRKAAEGITTLEEVMRVVSVG